MSNSKTSYDRPIVVFDTCSLLNLCQLSWVNENKEEITLLELVKQFFEIQIAPKVFEQFKDNLGREPEATRMINFVSRFTKNMKLKECKKIVGDDINAIPERPRKIELGEKFASAISLWISRNTSDFVTLVTDDYRVCNTLRELFHNHLVGCVLTSFDMLLFLYSRYHRLHYEEVETLIKELRSKFADKTRGNQTTGEKSQVDQEFDKALDRLEKICRHFRCTSKTCYEYVS